MLLAEGGGEMTGVGIAEIGGDTGDRDFAVEQPATGLCHAFLLKQAVDAGAEQGMEAPFQSGDAEPCGTRKIGERWRAGEIGQKNVAGAA